MATASSYSDPLSQTLANLRLSDSDDQKLSDKIQNYYDTHKQTEDQLSQKEETRTTMEEVLKHHLGKDAKVHIVGSSLTKFATSNSDMDIVLTKNLVDQEKANKMLKENSGMDILEFRNGPTVKVPIIRGRDRGRNVQWEMSFNKLDSIVKTKLLRAYSLLDPRVAPLVVAVKAWAGHVRVKDAHEGTLSSFSWTLMVICYLQSADPPVLPCLQTLDKVKYADLSSYSTTAVTLDVLERPPAFSSQNKNSLGGLLLGFFDFYSNKFKYTSQAISVRHGKLIPKYDVSHCLPQKQWKYFCIEEPYGETLTNTARAMFKPEPCQKVVSAIRSAYTQLSSTKTLPGLNF